MAGSISDSAAVNAVATSSSKNSATGVEHLRECASLFADGDHLGRQIREDAGLDERIGEVLAFADSDDRVLTALETRREEMEREAVSATEREAGRL